MSNPFDLIDQRLFSIEQVLQQILSATPKPKAESDIIGITEVATMLRISLSTIYSTKHNYPHKKVGGKLLFSRKEIEELVESKRVKTKEERLADTDNAMSKRISRKLRTV